MRLLSARLKLHAAPSFRVLAGLSAALLCCDPALTAEVKLLGAAATREAVSEMIPAFETMSGHSVVATWTGSANIRRKIAAGEICDLVIVGAPDLEMFVKDGKVVPGSRVDLIKSGVGVGVREGSTKPDIGSVDALKAAVLTAKSIAYSSGPSGTYLLKLFERMNIADEVGPRLKLVASGVRIGSVIASGEADIGFQQISELIHEPGVSYVGPLPPEVQNITVYSSGVCSAARQLDAARGLVTILTSSAARAGFARYGLEAP
jgi:molybdate transport system substrate-binding protein